MTANCGNSPRLEASSTPIGASEANDSGLIDGEGVGGDSE